MDDGSQFFGRLTQAEADRFMVGNRHPIREVAAKVIGDRPVTDLGCGKGIRIRGLYQPGQYTGVDCSAELIAIARRDNPGFTFVCAGILDYLAAVPDKSIPVALMVSVYEHVPSLAAALALYNEARRTSQELVIGWHCAPGPRTRIERVKADLDEPIWQNHYARAHFGGTIQSQPVDRAELWRVTD